MAMDRREAIFFPAFQMAFGCIISLKIRNEKSFNKPDESKFSFGASNKSDKSVNILDDYLKTNRERSLTSFSSTESFEISKITRSNTCEHIPIQDPLPRIKTSSSLGSMLNCVISWRSIFSNASK